MMSKKSAEYDMQIFPVGEGGKNEGFGIFPRKTIDKRVDCRYNIVLEQSKLCISM